MSRAVAYGGFYLALSESLPAEFWTADQHRVTAVDAPWVHYITDNLD